MLIILKKLLKILTLIVTLIASLVCLDNFAFNNTVFKKIVEQALKTQAYDVKIDNCKINYLTRQIKLENINFFTNKNQICQIKLANCTYAIDLKVIFSKDIKCSIKIHEGYIQNSITNKQYDIANWTIDILLNPLHVNKVSTVCLLNNQQQSLYLFNKRNELELTTQKFTLQDQEIRCQLVAKLHNGKIYNVKSQGQVINFVSPIATIGKTLKIPIEQNQKDIVYCPNINWDMRLNVQHKQIRWDKLIVAGQLSNIRFNELNLLSKPINFSFTNNNHFKIQGNIYYTVQNIERTLASVSVDTKSYDFTIQGQIKSIQDHLRQCLSQYNNSTLSICDKITNHLDQVKTDKSFAIAGNLKDLSSNTLIEVKIEKYFDQIKNCPIYLKKKNLDLIIKYFINQNAHKAQIQSSDQGILINVANIINKNPIALSLATQYPIYIKNLFTKACLNGVITVAIKPIIDANKIILDCKTNLNQCQIDVNLLKIHKAKQDKLMLDTTIELHTNKNYNQYKFRFTGDNKLNIAGSATQNKKVIINLDKIFYKTNACKAQLIHSKKITRLDVKGQNIDLSKTNLIEIIRFINIPDWRFYITSQVNHIMMYNNNAINKFYLDALVSKTGIDHIICNAKVNQTSNFFINTEYIPNPQKQFDITKKIKFFTDDFGALLSLAGYNDIISDGQITLDMQQDTSAQNQNIFKGSIQGKSFYIHNTPKILHLFSTTIFYPIMPKTNKTLFSSIKGKIVLSDHKVQIKNLMCNAAMFAFSISDGYVSKNEIQLSGYIVPSFIIPIVRPIPLPYKLKKNIDDNHFMHTQLSATS